LRAADRYELILAFVSGHTADVIAHRGVMDEGSRFPQKPCSRRDLAVKVRDVLEH
jgi:hypothetical protein